MLPAARNRAQTKQNKELLKMNIVLNKKIYALKQENIRYLNKKI